MRRLRALWRATLRPLWHDVRPAVLGGAVVAVFVLGTRGYERLHLPDGEHYGFWDAFVRAVRLFGFEGSFEGTLPTELKIAALLGPALVTYAAVIAFLRLSRERAQLLSIRLFARDHVIVAGLGEIGGHLARTFHDAHVPVVAIEVDEAAAVASGSRQHGVPVLLGDAADPTILARAQVRRARHLLVACGDDMRNVNVGLAARRSAAGRQRGVLSVLAHVSDAALWRRLMAEAVAGADPCVRLDFFNVTSAAARMAVERFSVFDGTGPAPHIGIAGEGELADAVLLHAATRWREVRGDSFDARLTVTFAARGGAAHVARLGELHPGLEEVCELRPVEGEPGEQMLATGAPQTVYLCLAPSETLAAGLALHRHSHGAVKVVALVAREDAARVFRRSDGGFADIEVFGVLDNVVTPALLARGTIELLAQARHAAYVRSEEARGESSATNASMRPWERLDESLRESNRRAADGISRWLELAGLTVVPAAPFAGAAPGFAFADDQVEELARLEHERWAEDLRRDGWRATSGEKDPARRLHPLLDVPWEQLGEVDRDRDREPIRLLPSMLLAVGLEVRPRGAAVASGEPIDLALRAGLGSGRQRA